MGEEEKPKDEFSEMISNFTISQDFDREEILELGKKGEYTEFPVPSDTIEFTMPNGSCFCKESGCVELSSEEPITIREWGVPMGPMTINTEDYPGISVFQQPDIIQPPPGFAFEVADHTIYIFCSCWWCKLKGFFKRKNKGGKNEV